MSTTPDLHTPNCYEILQLPSPTSFTSSSSQSPPTKEAIKAAYHRALLAHHPDKAKAKATAAKESSLSAAIASRNSATEEDARYSYTYSYSVDEIVAAYDTISDPAKRSAYDEHLRKVSSGRPLALSDGSGTHAGVETLDLEELVFEEETRLWRRGCGRCGDGEGHVVSEEALERESERGEVYVGCRGCSLFVRVMFDMVAEE